MNIIAKKKISVVLCVTMLSVSQAAIASNEGVYSGKVTYKTDHLYVPGSYGAYELWGRGASPEELWNNSADLEFQGFIAGLASIGAAIAQAAAKIATVIVSVVSQVVANAGGLATIVSNMLPQAIMFGKSMLMERIAAGDAITTANAENAAQMARLKVTLQADKDKAEIEAKTALEAEKIRAEEATKQAEIAAKQAIEIAKSGDAVKIAEAEQASKVAAANEAEAMKNLQAAAIKSKKIDEEVGAKLTELKAANNKVVATVDEQRKIASPDAATSSISPKFFEEKNSTQFAVDQKSNKSPERKLDPKSFQENQLKEAAVKTDLVVISKNLKRQSDIFNNSLKDLGEAKNKGLTGKDLDVYVKAVDVEYEKLQKLYKLTDENVDEFERLNAEDFDPEDLKELEMVAGDATNQPPAITEAQIDAIIAAESAEQLKELEEVLGITPEATAPVKKAG